MKKENYDENVVGEPIKVFAVRNMYKAIFVIIFAHQTVVWYLTIFWWKWGNKKFLMIFLKR